MSFIELLVAILTILGVFFSAVASLGVLIMPDIFLRMSASTKAATLGAGFILLAVALAFGDFSIAARAIAISLFLILTAPVGAHMIGRAAYYEVTEDGQPPTADVTVVDEMRDRYKVVNSRVTRSEKIEVLLSQTKLTMEDIVELRDEAKQVELEQEKEKDIDSAPQAEDDADHPHVG